MQGIGELGKLKRALGLMSGTSMDGIDVAVIETDGRMDVRRGPGLTYPYSDAFRSALRRAIADAGQIRRRDERPGSLHLAEQYLTDLHAEAVTQFLEDTGLSAADIDVIGFHGHTVLHRKAEPANSGQYSERDGSLHTLTVQIGDGARLAELTGIDVVFDLRAADTAAGGQGAPLAPVYHRALAARVPKRPLAVLNLGGVANVTWIGPGEDSLIAFDTGPASAMIDDWMQLRSGRPCDVDGATAAKGHVHDAIVTGYLRDPYFSAPTPKSLDRNAFDLAKVEGLPLADGAATLTSFAAAAIGEARAHLPEEPQLWIVCGGGRRNKTLMRMIAGQVQNAVVPAEAVGLDGNAVEAEAWAYLAVRSLMSLAISFPGTTGVERPISGGVVALAPRK